MDLTSPVHQSGRFVILHHRAPQGEHWDLMLERGETLATWQLLADPRRDDVWPISARRIGDHRRHYLTYEGPLGGGRGEVHRIASGDYDLISSGTSGWALALRGEYIAGRFELRATTEANAVDLCFIRLK